mmetsp:Transcript_14979/g.32480  ORF Transcript_14979/g.32480 Transcript_14979/m.32480 type:complete len:921 (-) Transcript_14979:196-2958(-)
MDEPPSIVEQMMAGRSGNISATGGDPNDVKILDDEHHQILSRGGRSVAIFTSNGAEYESTRITPVKRVMLVQGKQRKVAKITISAFIIFLFALETIVQRWINEGSKGYKGEHSFNKYPEPKAYPQRSQKSSLNPDYYAPYSISDDIKREYEQWHKLVRNLSQMELQPSNWVPVIDNWNHHPRERSDRFPNIADRVQFYMGKWYNISVPMYGEEFEKATFIQRKTTREFGAFSDILVNLYNLDKDQLHKCYRNKKELQVFSPYCRDYIDIAILHSEGSANVLHYIGDGLPYVPEEIRKYPLFAKVRSFCNRVETNVDGSDFENEQCKQKEIIEPILLPLNRKRHFGVASLVPENDVPWEQKVGRAAWRGKYGKTHDTLSNTNDIKYALVSKHLNSALVDAKFSKHTKDAPRQMIGSYMGMKDQLTYKYLISIEGNDVSSGLKWMLFSNSVVLTPRFAFESWAMEGKLKPFVHFIPLKADMSNVEEMIQWAEMHPKETQLISERSTLFVYDLLFHPDAIEDEKNIMMQLVEQFEKNFGEATKRQSRLDIQWGKHPSDRALRFPSVEERVKYAMGKWYRNEDALSMKRSQMQHVSRFHLNNDISRDGHFIASGHNLTECAMANSTYSKDIRLLCQSSLPDFDERNTADLKSNSFNRLQKSKKAENMRFAPKSSWRSDEKGMKESKRVLLDDAIKILCYGGCFLEEVNVPFFAGCRRNEDAIIWPFDVDNDVDIVKSGLIETVDIDFEDKKPNAIVGDGPGSSQPMVLTSSEFVSGGTAEAATDGFTTKSFIVDESSKRKDHIREMLSYRYVLANENEDGINEDLLWMLLSQSVVFMPAERRITSWLMEGFLKPYQHFVPVAFDYSDIEEQIKWCEENLEQAKMISERATLFVYDMLLDKRSEKDNEEVKFQVMERYIEQYNVN